MSIENLKAEAESLGIEVDGRWSEKRLQAEIDRVLGDGTSGETEADTEAEADQETTEQPATEPETLAPAAKKAGDVTVSNPTKCVQVVGFVRIKPGAKYTLDAEQKKDDLLMKRLRHAIKLGILTEV